VLVELFVLRAIIAVIGDAQILKRIAIIAAVVGNHVMGRPVSTVPVARRDLAQITTLK